MTKGETKPKRNASLKQLSGEGYFFEDKVGAYFLSFLLSGLNFTEELGSVIRIDHQNRADKIQLDDLLITFSARGVKTRLLLSVKSNQQITKEGAKTEFVKLCWIDFCNINGSNYDPDSDYLGLACSPIDPEVKNSIDKLINFAKGQESEILNKHIQTPYYTSDITRTIFSSFSCPSDLASKIGYTDDDTGKLLKRLIVIPFDFENNPSDNEAKALERCQTALISGSPDEARDLWEELIQISKWLSLKGGYVDTSRLFKFLKNTFNLFGNYEDRYDWTQIKTQTLQYLNMIPDKIAGRLTINRNIIESDNLSPNNRIIILLGESGSGKTVIAKHWAERQINSGTVIWINGYWINDGNPNSYGKRLGLTHDIAELLSRSPEQNGWIIIDSIEKINDQEISELFRIIKSIDISSPDSTWHVIVTCNSEAWGRINIIFIKNEFNSHNFLQKDISIFSDENITELEESFPQLKGILKNPKLKSLVYRPKILDLLAQHSVDISHWIGESDLIHWYWENEILISENGLAKNLVLLKIGEYEADNWVSGVILSNLQSPDAQIIQLMIAQNLCRRENQKIFFYHDILSDWARLQLIIGHEDNLGQYLNHRIDSPLWDRSIRLFGLHILEVQKDIKKWLQYFEDLKGEDKEFSKIHNLLLESIIFSLNPLPILESVMPELEKNDGLLLKRLVNQFLQVATRPNPMVVRLCSNEGIDETLGSIYGRIPQWEYWFRFIPFLLKYQDKISSIAPKSLLEITEKWLTYTEPDYKYRREFASLVCTIAESIKDKSSGYYRDKELAKLAYSCLLLAIREEPERVRKLLLVLSGKDPSIRPSTSIVEIEIDSRIYGKYIQKQLPPWEYGPYIRVDSVFKKICIEGHSLSLLILTNPELAKEIILSNIIEEPKILDPYDSDCIRDTIYGVSSGLYLRNALFENGPFLKFLRINPIEGLDLIIKLIDFSTTQWMNNKKDPSDDTDTVTEISLMLPSGPVFFKGDHCVYYWFRDCYVNFSPPPIITGALMALEKFFYDQIDDKLPIDQYIQYIYDHGKSIAFLGLLSSVGKYHPILFTGPLRFLFSVPEFHLWEKSYNAQSNGCLTSFWVLESKKTQEKLISWKEMRHRSHELNNLSIHFLLNYLDLNLFFEQTIHFWEERSKNSNDPLDSFFMKGIIEHHKRENYVEVEKDGNKLFEYIEPQELSQLREKFKESDEELAFSINISSFPFYCLKILTEHITLPEDELDRIWDFLHECQSSKEGLFVENVVTLEDVISGGIAVLYLNHRDWLKNNPEKLEWCIKTISHIISSPAQISQFDTPENYADWKWYCFCAMVIPYIWSENTEDEDIRSSILQLVTDSHYKTINLLLQSSFELRSILKEDFYRLIHISTIGSFCRRWYEFNHQLINNGYESDYTNWVDRFFNAFVNRELTSEIPNLLELSQINSDLQEKDNNSVKIPLRFTKYDLQAIQSCFSWMPSLSSAKSQDERKLWITINKNLDIFFIRDIENRVSYLKDHQYPDDVHNWYFQIQVRIICEMDPDDDSSVLWKPILSLPRNSEDFIQAFFTYWFIYVHDYRNNQRNFINSWKGMIDYALSLPSWNYSKGNPRDLDENWCSLIGIMTVSSDRWNENFIEIVTQMSDYYETWSSHNIRRIECLKRFTAFLTKSASSGIRVLSLIWLIKYGLDQIGEKFWKDEEQNGKLAELLNICWNNHYTQLVGNKQAFECFRLMLHQLTDLQVPLSMELSHRISEKPGPTN